MSRRYDSLVCHTLPLYKSQGCKAWRYTELKRHRWADGTECNPQMSCRHWQLSNEMQWDALCNSCWHASIIMIQVYSDLCGLTAIHDLAITWLIYPHEEPPDGGGRGVEHWLYMACVSLQIDDTPRNDRLYPAFTGEWLASMRSIARSCVIIHESLKRVFRVHVVSKFFSDMLSSFPHYRGTIQSNITP